MVLAIIVFIFVLGLLIFVHEFGHFIAAKRAGIKVEEFAFGFPPRLYAKKRGGTVYAINAIPLGGYVRLYGEDGKHASDPKSFYSKSLGVRFLVIVAGVVMNVVLGWFLFSIGYSFGLPVTSMPADKISGAKVTSEIVIADTLEDSAAQKAKLSKGDIILGANDQTFSQPEELSEFTTANVGQKITLTIKRYGATEEVPITLSKDEEAPLGVSILESEKVKVPIWRAPIVAAQETLNLIVLIFTTIGGFLVTLFATGKAQEAAGVGPVGIWFIFETATKLGSAYIVQLTALISINLAVLNILPFPALDGGRLVFLVIEAIRRKKVTPRIEGIVHAIGFALLIGLMLLITFRDIMRAG